MYTNEAIQSDCTEGFPRVPSSFIKAFIENEIPWTDLILRVSYVPVEWVDVFELVFGSRIKFETVFYHSYIQPKFRIDGPVYPIRDIHPRTAEGLTSRLSNHLQMFLADAELYAPGNEPYAFLMMACNVYPPLVTAFNDQDMSTLDIPLVVSLSMRNIDPAVIYYSVTNGLDLSITESLLEGNIS
jgi:hypothetical protein